MAFLLDTHTFLWFVAGDKQLPTSVKQKIEKLNNQCFISIASFWEIAIKLQLGKLELGISLKELFIYADRNDIEIIPISFEHLQVLLTLERHHNDPFDRLIIAQAIAENLIILSKDQEFEKYKIDVSWN